MLLGKDFTSFLALIGKNRERTNRSSVVPMGGAEQRARQLGAMRGE